MIVDVALTYEEVDYIDVQTFGAVAVIDVLRATTTMLTALEHGARGVVPVATPDEAHAWRRRAQDVVLGGERHARRIDGFDVGNSPLEYSPSTVAGKLVVLTTTNGTQSFDRVHPAVKDANHGVRGEEGPSIYAACLRNSAAVAATLVEEGRRTGRGALIVCSGTNGRFSREDAYGAAVLLSRMERAASIVRGDGAEAVTRIGATASDAYAELASSFHGRRLLDMGLQADVEFCGQTDVSSEVPRLISGMLVLAGTEGKHGE